jgi:hypothetical protein
MIQQCVDAVCRAEPLRAACEARAVCDLINLLSLPSDILLPPRRCGRPGAVVPSSRTAVGHADASSSACSLHAHHVALSLCAGAGPAPDGDRLQGLCSLSSPLPAARDEPTLVKPHAQRVPAPAFPHTRRRCGRVAIPRHSSASPADALGQQTAASTRRAHEGPAPESARACLICLSPSTGAESSPRGGSKWRIHSQAAAVLRRRTGKADRAASQPRNETERGTLPVRSAGPPCGD